MPGYRAPLPCDAMPLESAAPPLTVPTRTCDAFSACLGLGRTIEYDGECLSLHTGETPADGLYDQVSVQGGCIVGVSHSPAPEPYPSGTAFEVCLGLGRTLAYDGQVLSLQSQTPPPDGTYTQFTIVNGCITEVGQAPLPVYTPPACTPNPIPCAGGSGGAAATPEPSPLAGNLFTYDASQRPLVQFNAVEGTGIDLQGDGTASNPMRITCTVSPTANAYTASGTPDKIGVTGSGTQTQPYLISHLTAGTAGTYGGLTVDAYGHVTSYNVPSGPAISNILDSADITVTRVNGTAQLYLSSAIADGWRVIGGMNVQTTKGRIVAMTQIVNAPSGTYQFGDYQATFNTQGLMTDLVYAQQVAITPQTVRLGDYDVTYTANGLTSAVTYVPPSPTPDTPPQQGTSKLFSAGTASCTCNFALSVAAPVRISAKSESWPSPIQLTVNSIVYAFDLTLDNSLELLIPAAFPASTQHSVTLSTTDSAGFPSKVIIDVVPIFAG